ncbi:hypothetical protein BC831DRAFT_442081 [Entophlyctis helioformis]|nr:hypothetical protein BC831DRAFT_442081 [Entophlyctis helioformis]
MASAGTVVDAFNMSIKAKDIQTLKGSSWLNDEVINFYAELCMRRANESPDLFPKIHIFNTFFYEKLRTQGFNSVRRWTRRIDLFSKDYVIVPVHLGAHWTCAAISLKHKRFEYYDSLHGDNELCLELLRSYIAQESVDKKKTAMDLDEWEDYMPKDIPAQQNGFDCGVFTCMFMEHIAREAPFTFSQKHMPVLRQRIAYEILTASLFPR